jgi:transposase
MKNDKGLVMRQVVEIARLHESGLNKSEIHRSINISRPTIDWYLEKFQELDLKYDDMKNMPWKILRKKIFPAQPSNKKKFQPKWNEIYEEMKRPNMTLSLLYSEWIALNKDRECIGYSRFCKYYSEFDKSKRITMKQFHRPGEKAFIDYAGTTMPITDRDTGEITKAQIFVSTLGFSNFTFACAFKSQSIEEFLYANTKSFRYFSGVPAVSVSDNLKSAVKKPSLYDPLLNPLYQEFAIHYDTTVVPARTYRPKDKAKVENAVLNVSRQILAPLRDRTFHSIGELNIAIAELVETYNSKPQQSGIGSRRTVFEAEEKHLLRPLPQQDFQFVNWKKAKVGFNYHVVLEGHSYSVPYEYVSKEVDVRYSSREVNITKDDVLIAHHLRGVNKGTYSTMEEHMPQAHLVHFKTNPERIKEAASKIGPNVFELISRTFDSHRIPEVASRQCLGITRLPKKFKVTRIEAAAKLLLSYSLGLNPYHKMKSILDKGIDEKYINQEQANLDISVVAHENIRGETYFQ